MNTEDNNNVDSGNNNNNDNGSYKYSKELIQLRRDKVLELTAQSVSQVYIARQLGVSQAVISLDLQYLRCRAQENTRDHIETRIPMQYSVCEAGLKLILRKVYQVMDKSTRPQDQLNAMSLAADIYAKLMDLSTNGAILTRNLKMIEEMKKILPTEGEQKRIDKVLSSPSSPSPSDKENRDDNTPTEDGEDIITETEEDVPTEDEEELPEE